MKMRIIHAHAKNRRGLSLMEILAAVFVLMVGLLGVLAVIPFGLFQMSRINKADFGGNCGRAAIREIQVRGYASSYASLTPNDTAPWNLLTGASGVMRARCDRPIIVDPLSVFANYQTSGHQYDSNAYMFPYGVSDGFPRISPTYPAEFDRTNYSNDEDWKNAIVNYFSYIFHSQEDGNYVAPGQPTSDTPRPVGVVGGNGMVQSFENYSWFYMLTPQVRGAITYNQYNQDVQNYASYAEADRFSGFDLDVIVCFQRRPARIAEEAKVFVDLESDGFRGGQVILSTQTGAGKETLDLTDTRYLFLWTNEALPNKQRFAKWYKIVNAGPIEENGNRYQRRVMLLGADIPTGNTYFDPENSTGSVPISHSAALIKGVIEVYSTVVSR